MKIDKDLFLKGVIEKYDERLLENRVTIEGNVLACIYTDLLTLDEITIDKTMFLTKDALFYYGLAKDIRTKGFNVIDEVTILSNSSEPIISRFEEYGGYETIKHMTEIVNKSNFEIYLDQLYRENMLCKMYLDGFNLFKPKEINGKRVVPIDLFRKMTSEQVLDYFESELTCYEVGQSSNILQEGKITFDDEWLNSLKNGNNLGTPYETAGLDINGEPINCYQFLSKQTLGIHNGTLSVLAAFPSTGKSTWIITLLASLMHNGRTTMIISNEEEIEKFKAKFLCWTLARYNRYTNLSKQKLESGNFNENDYEQIKIARKYWDENYDDKIYFVSVNSTDMKIVSKKIREYVLKYGVDMVVFDTFKLADDSFSGERTDLALVRDSRELFKIARKYNIPILATAQLAERYKGTLFLNASHLSGAKAIKEICELLFEMRRVYEEELNPDSKYYMSPFQRKLVNGRWREIPYKVDPKESYAILFPEKNRRGNDSSNGEAYLLKFLGYQSVFKEVAYCRPKHGFIQ